MLAVDSCHSLIVLILIERMTKEDDVRKNRAVDVIKDVADVVCDNFKNFDIANLTNKVSKQHFYFHCSVYCIANSLCNFTISY